MPKELSIDFETRSVADLPECGLDIYAAHPSTDIICMAYAFDDEPVQLWVPEVNSASEVVHHIADGKIVKAFNANFEFAIWNALRLRNLHWEFPELKTEQLRCTQAACYAMALPGNLEQAAAALGLRWQKDMQGHRIMLQLCRPKTTDPLTWHDDPAKLQALYDYCKRDVECERELSRRIVPLSPNEQALWQLDSIINRRGVRVDRQAVHFALRMVEDESAALHQQMREVTNGVVATCNAVSQLTEWLIAQGIQLEGVAKADLVAVVESEAFDLGLLPPAALEAIRLRQRAGKSSLSKLRTMLNVAGADDRLRYTLQFCGANTGRWAARKVQLHNLKRTEKPYQGHESLIIDAIRYQRPLPAPFDADPMAAMANCMRSFLCAAPGHSLLRGDYSNIEGRVLAWLAGEQWKLDAFSLFDMGVGPDIYILAYAKSFNVPLAEVTDAQRQVGKVEELALGFGGGVGAFQTMAKNYGVRVNDQQAELIKQGWRAAHPNVVSFWYALEEAAISAAANPGVSFPVRTRAIPKIKFKMAGSFLWCQLPSGRVLCYPYPSVKEVKTPWDEMKPALHYKTVMINGKWGEIHTYGGSLAENVTQAVARDILAEALRRVEFYSFNPILHVHDEIVCELPEAQVDTVAFRKHMEKSPEWARGLPIAVKATKSFRYAKD